MKQRKPSLGALTLNQEIGTSKLRRTLLSAGSFIPIFIVFLMYG